MAMVGGMKAPEPATAEVQELLDGIRKEVEEKAGSSFAAYEAKLYATQLVNGVNYFVKVHVGDEKFVHIRFHKAFSGTVTLSNIQHSKVEADPLSYF
ncbi:cystatin-B-like [Ptychodera flava]|uniref:cystatin-B-like n=1 Tax=Ptychodera flava TaxID=63121 RepID=UPI003969C15D